MVSIKQPPASFASPKWVIRKNDKVTPQAIEYCVINSVTYRFLNFPRQQSLSRAATALSFTFL